MKYIHILVEGQTEETFVRDILTPHLIQFGIYPTPKLAVTKRVKSGKDFKGGITSYQRVKFDLQQLLKDTHAVLVTTMLDYYNLPADFPRHDERPVGTCFERVTFLEQAVKADIAHPRFLPYLELHEFEAMMFVDPDAIARELDEVERAEELHAIKNKFETPEEINEDEPPAKRLQALFKTYQKPFHGPLVTDRIGLDAIRQSCLHFASWLSKLETFGSNEKTAPTSR